MILLTEYGNVYRYNAHKEAFSHPVLLVLENAKEVTRAWHSHRRVLNLVSDSHIFERFTKKNKAWAFREKLVSDKFCSLVARAEWY